MLQRPKMQPDAGAGASARTAPLPDVELVELAKGGRTDAYAELVNRYQDRVFNCCWRIVGHLEDARDLTQETFLKAFLSLSSFRAESGFYTWVFRVAVNLSLSHRRSAKRRRETSYDTNSDGTGTQAEPLARQLGRRLSVEPPEPVEEAEVMSQVVKALNTLDDDFRAVVVLRDVEGFDYDEIGKILEIPPGTVKSRLHRARAELRKALLPHVSESQSKRKK